MNFAQVFRTPYGSGPEEIWVPKIGCAYCGRVAGERPSCDGCGAPVLAAKVSPICFPDLRYLPDDFVWTPNQLIRARR